MNWRGKSGDLGFNTTRPAIGIIAEIWLCSVIGKALIETKHRRPVVRQPTPAFTKRTQYRELY
jgi:hypothetical protein